MSKAAIPDEVTTADPDRIERTMGLDARAKFAAQVHTRLIAENRDADFASEPAAADGIGEAQDLSDACVHLKDFDASTEASADEDIIKSPRKQWLFTNSFFCAASARAGLDGSADTVLNLDNTHFFAHSLLWRFYVTWVRGPTYYQTFWKVDFLLLRLQSTALLL